MTADIRLTNDAVIIDGALASGTDSPKRPVHVQGAEIHTGGSGGGYSFADRAVGTLVDNPGSGQRWVWYAQNGAARLWSGGDALSVRRAGGGFATEVAGSLKTGPLAAERVDTGGSVSAKTLTAESGAFKLVDVDGTVRADQLQGDRVTTTMATFDDVRTRVLRADALSSARLVNVVAERVRGAGAEDAVNCRATALALSDPAAPEVITGPITELAPGGRSAGDPGPGPGPIPEPTTPVPPRLALSHEFGPGKDRLVLNRFGRYVQGTHVDGSLTASGAISQASSITVKEDVRALSTEDALGALAGLSPVTYRYVHDTEQVRHVGFVAEEVPDLVAQPGRDRLSPMDIVAVLTAAVRDQQRRLAELTAELADLRAR